MQVKWIKKNDKERITRTYTGAMLRNNCIIIKIKNNKELTPYEFYAPKPRGYYQSPHLMK